MAEVRLETEMGFGCPSLGCHGRGLLRGTSFAPFVARIRRVVTEMLASLGYPFMEDFNCVYTTCTIFERLYIRLRLKRDDYYSIL